MSAGATGTRTVYTALSLDDVLELLAEESRNLGRLLRAQVPV